MTTYVVKAGRGPGINWPLSGKVHATREAARAEAALHGGPHPYDPKKGVAVYIQPLRNVSTEPRRPSVIRAVVAAPVLRKAAR